MNCDLCEAKASVFLTQIIEGQMKKINLCEGCSQEKGVTDPTGFALADLLVGIGSEQQAAGSHIEGSLGTAACGACGFTEADFKRIGRLGCPSCYSTFKDELAGIIKAMHKGTRHTGKGPKNLDRIRAVTSELEELRESLGTAVEEENYEAAADLRDRISKVESDLELARQQRAEENEKGGDS